MDTRINVSDVVHRIPRTLADEDFVPSEERTPGSVVSRIGGRTVRAIISYSVEALARGVGIVTGATCGAATVGLFCGRTFASHALHETRERMDLYLSSNQTLTGVDFCYDHRSDCLRVAKWSLGIGLVMLTIGAPSGALIVDRNRHRICAVGYRIALAGQSGASWFCRKLHLMQ